MRISKLLNYLVGNSLRDVYERALTTYAYTVNVTGVLTAEVDNILRERVWRHIRLHETLLS
jgi:hypothetical protein